MLVLIAIRINVLDDPVVFSIKMSGITIKIKLWLGCQLDLDKFLGFWDLAKIFNCLTSTHAIQADPLDNQVNELSMIVDK